MIVCFFEIFGIVCLELLRGQIVIRVWLCLLREIRIGERNSQHSPEIPSSWGFVPFPSKLTLAWFLVAKIKAKVNWRLPHNPGMSKLFRVIH